MPRKEFTLEEDHALARYLAEHNPSKAGRSGRAIYEQIEKHAAELGPWASAHSAQSWRDRYIQNQGRIDVYIARHQLKHGVDAAGPQRLLDRDVQPMNANGKRVRGLELSSQAGDVKRTRVEGAGQSSSQSQALESSRDSWSRPLPTKDQVEASTFDLSLQLQTQAPVPSQPSVKSQAPPTPPRTNSIASPHDSSASVSPSPPFPPYAQRMPQPRLTPTPRPPSRFEDISSDDDVPRRYPRQYEDSPFRSALTASNGRRRISSGGKRETGVEEESSQKSWPPSRGSQRRTVEPMHLDDDSGPPAVVEHPRIPLPSQPAARPKRSNNKTYYMRTLKPLPPPPPRPQRPQPNAIASSSKVKLPDAARLSPRTAARILAPAPRRASAPAMSPPREEHDTPRAQRDEDGPGHSDRHESVYSLPAGQPRAQPVEAQSDTSGELKRRVGDRQRRAYTRGTAALAAATKNTRTPALAPAPALRPPARAARAQTRESDARAGASRRTDLHAPLVARTGRHGDHEASSLLPPRKAHTQSNTEARDTSLPGSTGKAARRSTPAVTRSDGEEDSVVSAPKNKRARRSAAPAPAPAPAVRSHKRRETFHSFGKTASARKSLQSPHRRRKSIAEPASQSYIGALRRDGILPDSDSDAQEVPANLNLDIDTSPENLRVVFAVIIADLVAKYGFGEDTVMDVMDAVRWNVGRADEALGRMREAARGAFRESLGLVENEAGSDGDGGGSGHEQEDGDGDEGMDVDEEAVDDGDDEAVDIEDAEDADMDGLHDQEKAPLYDDDEADDGEVIEALSEAVVESSSEDEDEDEDAALPSRPLADNEYHEVASRVAAAAAALDETPIVNARAAPPTITFPLPSTSRRRRKSRPSTLKYTPISPSRVPYSPPPHTHARTYTRLSNSGRREEAEERLMSSPIKSASRRGQTGTASPSRQARLRRDTASPTPQMKPIRRLRPASSRSMADEEEQDYGDQDPYELPLNLAEPLSQALPKSSHASPKSPQSLPKSSQLPPSSPPKHSSQPRPQPQPSSEPTSSQLRAPNTPEQAEIRRWITEGEIQRIGEAEKVYGRDVMVKAALEWVCGGVKEGVEEDAVHL